ncbi:glycosyltransferase family 4 protein [Arthrobacter sp. RIT-PI-e]|uniref:glycosyltransferase family 4 protein n=1 Tax=Arthrobacter sp. RIT-PI-e TaxID=1681197 RepID=UPI00128F0E7A|nr:glycosyltransferase family 4 protein [Arthrobacter sp. RIT-PI-e]
MAEGRRQKQPWRQVQGPWTRGGTQKAYYRFLAELALNHPRTKLWHVHMGGRAKWARGRFKRPYILTLHGTDIKENYWQDEHHAQLKADVDLARHVFYTTPELREKAERARPDAEYMPQAMDLSILPEWTPAARPRVFFPSRWDAQKGGDGLLETAAQVVSAVGNRADVVGLDWGNRASEAAGLGVTLMPKMDLRGYVAELARAHVAVGQTAGILSVSELQAMAIGVPLVFPDPVEGYPQGEDMGAIVVARQDAGAAVLEALADPHMTSESTGGPAYVRRHHDPAGMIERLEAVYADVSEQSEKEESA